MITKIETIISNYGLCDKFEVFFSLEKNKTQKEMKISFSQANVYIFYQTSRTKTFAIYPRVTSLNVRDHYHYIKILLI